MLYAQASVAMLFFLSVSLGALALTLKKISNHLKRSPGFSSMEASVIPWASVPVKCIDIFDTTCKLYAFWLVKIKELKLVFVVFHLFDDNSWDVSMVGSTTVAFVAFRQSISSAN
jgi:hypothetical protein